MRRRTHEDFAEEVASHLELEIDRLVGEGMTRDQARDAALKSFGNVLAARERFYEASRWTWLDSIRQDLKYAWRSLRRQPSFVATTVLTLAVGLALVTVAFTVFNAYVLRPFAVRDPSTLHQIGWRSPSAGGWQFQWSEYEALRDRADLFDSVVAEHTRFVSSRGLPLGAGLVSSNYFDTLGPRLTLGRPLSSIDAAPGNNAVVLSHEAWRRLFGADPGAIGREIDLNGRPFIITGIVAPEFTGLGDLPRDLWVLASAYAPIAAPELLGTNQPREFAVIGRLRPGILPAHARVALAPMLADLLRVGADVRALVQPHSSHSPLTFELVAILSPVFAAFGLVLVTTCANVSNVMLARAIARHREIAVRLSIGASRGRIVRQLLTEGFLIALVSGIAGLLLVTGMLRAGTVLFFSTLPPSVAAMIRLEPLTLDHRVFLFVFAAAGVTTLLFALVPSLQASRLTLTDALRGQDGNAHRSSRLRSALVVAQVAGALVLVIVALTLARNGSSLDALALGYDPDGVISINVRDEAEGLVPKLADVLAADPRVAAFAVTGGNPLFIRTRQVAASPGEGRPAVPTRYTFVSPEYFSLLRIPVSEGRGFLQQEAQSSAPVAIVSRSTAQAFWPGQDPIGKTITIEAARGRPVDELPEYKQVTVVGTVPDVVSGLVVDGHDDGHIYLATHARDAHATALLMRGRTPADTTPEMLQEIMRPLNIDPQVFEALPLAEMQQLQAYPLLAASWVGSFLSVVAVVLSISGLYGVLTFAITQRTREVGIRMALGATAHVVVSLVVRQSVRLAGLGAAAGLIIAFGTLKTLSTLIHLERISLLDVVAFGAAVLLVLAGSAAAAYGPARRAAHIDPAETLRADV